MNNVAWVDGAWVIRRVKKSGPLMGRSSFKVANLLSMHYSGRGNEYPGGALDTVKGWIAHNQQLFGREDVVLRVFGETGGWKEVAADAGMFGSPARDMGIWDHAELADLCRKNDHIRSLTGLHTNVLDEAFKLSHETGCIFEWCIVATLKHSDGMCVGTIGHAIRQTLEEFAELQEKYPNAAIIVNACNEWDAHNEVGVDLHEVNQWAQRCSRWVSPDGMKKAISFEAPGPGWEAEGWPSAFFIVDHGGQDTWDYDVGPEAGKYKMGALHPQRKGNASTRFEGRDWWYVPESWLRQLRDDARGQPLGATESMFFVSRAGTEGWYGNVNGWNNDADLQLTFYENMTRHGAFDCLVVHDDVGAQTDPSWAMRFPSCARWEAELREFLGTPAGPPAPPPPPPGPKQTTYAAVIAYAYRELLGREPDRSGLEYYDLLMATGSSEAQMREHLIRSAEFAEKNKK